MIFASGEHPRTSAARRGFTLVELMVTILILSILSSMLLFAAASAQQAARKAKTRTMITKIHTLLMERWDSYRTRRVPIDNPPGTNTLVAARDRLNAIRLIQQMEMPDRWSEISIASFNSPFDPPIRTALARAYYRRYQRVANHPSRDRYQGAECLYLIITMATGDGTALEQFSDSDIGDVDGDGAPEFLDGWGKPISYVRWPAGYRSDIQTGDADKDHDPFDPFRGHAGAYRLVPLVYSAGPDDRYGIATRPDASSNVDNNTSWYPGFVGGFVDPYQVINPNDPGIDQVQMGTAFTADQHLDNLTNHLLGP